MQAVPNSVLRCLAIHVLVVRIASSACVSQRDPLFVCGGAFVGLEDIIAKRLGRGSFGFDQLSETCQVAADGLLRQVKPEDLEAFGLIPEFIGRLPVIAPLDVLGVDDLAHILRITKNSLIQQFRELVRFQGAGLVFTDAAVREIAIIGFERGTGAGDFDRWSRRSWRGFCSTLRQVFGT